MGSAGNSSGVKECMGLPNGGLKHGKHSSVMPPLHAVFCQGHIRSYEVMDKIDFSLMATVWFAKNK